jgi:hypothetical protein
LPQRRLVFYFFRQALQRFFPRFMDFTSCRHFAMHSPRKSMKVIVAATAAPITMFTGFHSILMSGFTGEIAFGSSPAWPMITSTS